MTDTIDTRGYGLRLARRRARDWLAEFNPFYLLSAASMLGGLVLLAGTTSYDPAPLPTLLTLLATLQVYELLCVGVVALLYRKLGGRRDTYELAGLVAVFAVDASLLMSEVAADRPGVGAAVGLGLFVLALVKLRLVTLALRVRLGRLPVMFGLAGLALLHATPAGLAWLDGPAGGGVTVDTFLVLWWVVAAAPLAARGLWVWAGRPEVSTLRRLLMWLPWGSLAAHVGVLHYVYDQPFVAAHAAPLLLGAAVAVGGQGANLLTLALPAVAAWLSLDPRRFAEPGLVAAGGLATAYMAFVVLNLPRWWRGASAAGVAAAAWWWAGPSAQQIADALRQTGRGVWSAVPRTRGGWGAVAVVGAFVLLTCGVAVSTWTRGAGSEADDVEA